MVKNRGKTPNDAGVREQPRRARALPLEACTECGATMRGSTAATSLPVNGEEIVVPGVPHLACARCGNTLTRFDHAQAQHLAAIAIYRERHGLMTGSEIRGLRLRHRMTQAQLARLLGLGTNTLSRWEAGRNVQTAAMDILLRLVRDVPGNLEYLRRHGA